jgi:hypothetical protein
MDVVDVASARKGRSETEEVDVGVGVVDSSSESGVAVLGPWSERMSDQKSLPPPRGLRVASVAGWSSCALLVSF